MMQKGKAVIVATLLAIAACGGDSAGPPDTNGGGVVTATHLELAFTRAGAALAGGAQITVGDTVQATATAFSSSGATVSGVGIDWTAATGTLVSSEAATGANGARATWVVGTTPGTQSLSANIRNASVQTSASLSAVAGPAIRLGLQPGYAIFITGRRQIPVVAVDRFGNPAGSGSANSWISLDPSIATISSAGDLTGVAAGSARIVAVQSGRADTMVVPVLNPAALKQGQIAAGLSFSCRLDRDGRAICWGNGRWGQLGGWRGIMCPRARGCVRATT